MGTQAGLDFCDKLAKLNRGKLDQKYPMFVLYNKSNTPRRAENLKQYKNVLKELIAGCRMLENNKCKFIVMPCNTAHYWHEDIQKKINVPFLSMPKEVYLNNSRNILSLNMNRNLSLLTLSQIFGFTTATITVSVSYTHLTLPTTPYV